MESLIRRQSMMYGSKPVTYDGIPLMITNVGDEPIEVSLRFNALRKTEPPIIYYNTTGKKSYKKWDLSNITLAKGGTLYLFGENSVVDSTFVVNGNSSIHLDGKLEALLQGQVGTTQFGNYALEGLFKDVTQLESVGDIMPRIIGGVNAPSGWSTGYRYSSLFENTGIVEIPNNFLKETALGAPHLGIYHRMFFGCTKLTTIPRDLFINQSSSSNFSYQSMFQNCSNLEAAADIYCQSQAFMTTASMYRGCKKITDVKVFTKTLASNHCMRYFVADCDNLQSIDFDIDRVTHWGVLDCAMLNCPKLTKVSIKVKTWGHEQASITDHGAYGDWMKGVSPTGTFICPKELAEETDGYYDEEGNFVEGVGRGESTVPAGWTIDYPIIDARDGDANAMALMAVIFAQEWSKNSLYMMKSEAEKVEDIGTVFSRNTSIKDFTAFKYFINVRNIPASAFTSNWHMKIALPRNIESIGDNAFNDNGEIIGALPPNLVSLTSTKVFQYNKIQKLYFGENLTSIGTAYSIFNASAIHSVKVHENNANFYTEQGCIIRRDTKQIYISDLSATIPSDITSIGDGAMQSRSQASLTVPANVTSIGISAFSSSKFTTISFLGQCSIGDSAFSSCTSLSSVDFSNVTSIGSYAFLRCNKLAKIELPSICKGVSGSSFSGCTNITTISVAEENQRYDSRDGCNAVIETATNTLIRGCVNTTIPEGITTISNCAFAGVHFTSITLPNSITHIQGEAFAGCNKLTSITLPVNVESIGNYAFNGCIALTTITSLKPTPPTLGVNNYQGTVTDVYVPAGSVELYKVAANWKQYANVIKAIPE